jgi:hypothetical protein
VLIIIISLAPLLLLRQLLFINSFPLKRLFDSLCDPLLEQTVDLLPRGSPLAPYQALRREQELAEIALQAGGVPVEEGPQAGSRAGLGIVGVAITTVKVVWRVEDEEEIV